MLAVIVCGSPTDYVIGGVPADTIVAPAKPDVVIRDTTLMDGTPYTGSTAGTAGTAGISATAPDIPAFPRGAWDLSLQPRPRQVAIFCGAELNYADRNFLRLYDVLLNLTPEPNGTSATT